MEEIMMKCANENAYERNSADTLIAVGSIFGSLLNGQSAVYPINCSI